MHVEPFSDVMDLSNSECTEDQPGMKATIICPDGRKEEAKFPTMTSCFIEVSYSKPSSVRHTL